LLGVHHVELGLKLQAQLHLFLMVLGVLHVLFLKPEPQGPLIGPISLHVFIVLLQGCNI